MATGNPTIMESRNFEFLRDTHPELADLGGFAEHYAHSDPSSALIKLRQFGENLVADFFQHFQQGPRQIFERPGAGQRIGKARKQRVHVVT